MTLREFVNFFDFDYEKDEEGYHLIDLQGADLGDIESEVFETKEEVVGRFAGSMYEIDYLTDDLADEFGYDVSEAYEDMIEWCKARVTSDPRLETHLRVLETLQIPETVTETIKRRWKVYGAEGHRQKMSFYESDYWDFSEYEKDGTTRKLWFDCSDKTGTNDYVRVTIERDSAEECERELEGQVTDGYFENVRTGKVEEILPDGTAVEVFLYPYQRKEPPKPSVAPPVSRGPRM